MIHNILKRLHYFLIFLFKLHLQWLHAPSLILHFIVAWVIAAFAISSYTRLFHTLFTDDRILRPIFHASLALFSINVTLTMYLTVYLPFKFPQLSSSPSQTSASSSTFWDIYCPRVIPTMTACGVIGSFLLVRSCYPVVSFSLCFVLCFCFGFLVLSYWLGYCLIVVSYLIIFVASLNENALMEQIFSSSQPLSYQIKVGIFDPVDFGGGGAWNVFLSSFHSLVLRGFIFQKCHIICHPLVTEFNLRM